MVNQGAALFSRCQPQIEMSPRGGGALHLDGAGQSALRLAVSLCPPAKLAEAARRLDTAAAVIK